MTALALWAGKGSPRTVDGSDVSVVVKMKVFTEANRFGADYEVMLYSADGREVASSTGMRFGVNAAAADCGPCGDSAGGRLAQFSFASGKPGAGRSCADPG